MSGEQLATVSVSKIHTMKQKVKEEVTVGKDVLDLLTGAMYVDPLSIYREYIQNATDGIDDAQQLGLYEEEKQEPLIKVFIDRQTRSIRLRDNGAGVPREKFQQVLTAIGGSQKRGTSHRGFRGVGRLSGLGYCQELVFRSMGDGDSRVSELIWDGRRLKEILNDSHWKGGLEETVKEVASFATQSSEGENGHFFEVELRRVVRLRNDVLLNEEKVRSYIAQVCPVSFHSDFRYSSDIEEFLAEHGVNSNYRILLNDDDEYIYRPHRDVFKIKENLDDQFHDLRFFTIDGINGSIDAAGWILDSNYHGAIPKTLGIHGIRLRSGNIQVGPENIVAEDVFPETRFNSWTVGEVHALNKKLTPNGRRDHFEQNIHFGNLVGNLAPYGTQIAKECRQLSSKRNKLKVFELQHAKATELHDVIKQGVAPEDVIREAKREISSSIGKMRHVIEDTTIEKSVSKKLAKRVSRFEKSMAGKKEKNEENSSLADLLKCLDNSQKNMLEDIFELIYEHHAVRTSAKSMIDKLVSGLAKRYFC